MSSQDQAVVAIAVSAIVVILSGLLPLGAGLKWWRLSPGPIKVLTGLLIYQTAANSMELALALNGKSNMILFRAYWPITYGMLAWMFSYFFQGIWVQVARYSIPVYAAVYALMMILRIESIEGPDVKYSLGLLSLLVVVFSLYTLYLLLRSKSAVMSRDYRFWIAMGSLVYFATNIVIFSTMSREIILAMWVIPNSFLAISYLLYFKGYLCLR